MFYALLDVLLKQATLWEEEGCDMSTFTTEELVFSALNHDLGKMGR
jgi:predicted HD phosphohydrolase